jgi:catechol 2,3-dioxygenase-like lactoylglutathione lyase family enzyme
MIKTFGLTHIALPVKDVKRSSNFYQKIFGTKEMYSDPEFIQVQTPGSKDIIVFQKQKSKPNKKAGIHFGFRLQQPASIKRMMSVIKKAGGKIKETGAFIPGEPYVFFYDPDGYEVEIWFENIPSSLKAFN